MFSRLSLNVPCISESCTEIKIDLKFYFRTFKAFIKPFEAPQRSLKIKINLIFSLSGIGTGSVIGKSHLWFLYLRMSVRGLQLKTTKLIKGFVYNFEKCSLQRQSFWQLYLVKLGYYQVWGFSSFGIWYVQGFQQGLPCWSSAKTLMEFKVRHLTLFCCY